MSAANPHPDQDPMPRRDVDPQLREDQEYAFLRATSLLLLLVGLWLAWPLRAPIVLALVVAFIAYPLYRFLLKRLRFRALAASIVLLLVSLLLLIPLGIIGWLLAQQVLQVVERIRAAGSVDAFLEGMLTRFGIPADQSAMLLHQIQERIASVIEAVFLWSLRAALDLTVAVIVFTILLFFLLIEGDRLLQFLRSVTPMSRDRRHRLLDIIGERVQAIIYGSIIVALLQGGLAGLGWWILGLPYPVFWGFVMFILSVIPVVGAFVVLLPAAAWAFMQGDVWVGSGLLVLNFLIVGIVDDVVRPYVIGRRSRVHPTLVLVGIIGGVFMLGFIGFILGPLLLGLIPPLLRAWMRPGEGPLDRQS